MFDHHNGIKEAILEGDTVESKGCTIHINANDEVEFWPPEGKGFVTNLSNLDLAVSDFCKKAEIPVPGVNEQQPDAISLPDDILDKDSETNKSIGKEPNQINKQINPKDQPNSSFSNSDLKRDTESSPLRGSDPIINTRPRSRDYGHSELGLDPDTSSKEMKTGNRIIDTFESYDKTPDVYREIRARRPSQELLDGIMDEDGWTARNRFSNIDYKVKVNEQQPDVLDVDEIGDNAGTYDRKKEIDEKALPEYKLAQMDAEGCDYKKGEAPPGEKWERMVKDLKKDPDVDDPYAVAWAQYNKSKGKESRKRYPFKRTNKKAKSDYWDELVDIADRGGRDINNFVDFLAEVLNGGIEQWILNGHDSRQVRESIKEVASNIGYMSLVEIIGQIPDQITEEDLYGESGEEINTSLKDKLDNLDNEIYIMADGIIEAAVDVYGNNKEANKTAGPKLREKWTGDGGYARDIEAESAEELHNLTRAFGGEEMDWSSTIPKNPEEQEAEDRIGEEELIAREANDKEAVDESAKDYWSNYFKEYGEQLTRDDVTKRKNKPKDKNKSKEAQLNQLPDEFIDRSMSSGTLNEEEIISAIELELKGVLPDSHPIYTLIDEFWESEEDSEERPLILNEEIFDLLTEIAPEGTAFGSHEGNASDFGFWSYEEENEDFYDDISDLGEELEPRFSNKKSQQVQEQQPEQPVTTPEQPEVAPTPAKPAPKAPVKPTAPSGDTMAPGTGDSGLLSLGWTKEDIQLMDEESKKKILQIKLKKPGSDTSQAPVPAKPAPVETKELQVNQKPIQPTTPDQQKLGPTAGKKSQQIQETIEPTPTAEPTPVEPVVDMESTEEKAFNILREVQQMEVSAASPEQVSSMKASILAERLLTEAGITIEEAKKLYGVEGKNLFKIL